jgi:hypothetical protein
MVTVGDPAVDCVCVRTGDTVLVIDGVKTVDVIEGVKMTCRVRAAAVWISLGGATCSTGVLQARREATSITAGKLIFNRRFI